MNLLMVSPSFPRRTWGAGTRNYYLLKMLAREHTISLLTLIDKGVSYEKSLLEGFTHTVRSVARPPSRYKRLRQLKSAVSGKSYLSSMHTLVNMQEALDDLLTRDHYDAVLFESVLIAGYRIPEGVKIIIDQHNIEHELLERTYQRETAWLRKWYNWLESRRLKPIEIERCQRAHLVLVTSERERLLLKGMLPHKVIEVVPNGVDTEMFQETCLQPEIPGRIIFTGAMSYYPNVDAVLHFAQHCWPLIRTQMPGATWQIVGSNPSPEIWQLAKLPGVTVTGSVPDVRPYLTTAAVVIAPLLIGSGTRLKILEALAMQKAVVSTNIGCEGLSVLSGEHLLVADQDEAFTQAVIDLIRNPEMRIKLGMAGRSLVEAEYSWERCGAKLLHILEKAI